MSIEKGTKLQLIMEISSVDNYDLVHKPNKVNWRKRCEEFVSESSFGDVLYVFLSKSWIKRIFWALVILTAIGGFVTVTTLNIRMLLREPISTSITLKREDKLDFPSVTICNLNVLDATKLSSVGSNVVGNLTTLFNAILDYQDSDSCTNVAKSLASQTQFNIGWGDLTALAGYDLTTILLTCVYQGIKCSADNFTQVNTAGGRCYTFNIQNNGKKLIADGTGIRKGLRLQLLSNPVLPNDGFSIFRDYGYRIIIHNPDEPPRPESDGIVVSLNSTTYIGMKQVISIDNTLISSATRCRNDYKITENDLLFLQYSLYSLDLCEEKCFHKYVIEKCNCVERMLYNTPLSGQFSQKRNCVATDLCCEVQAFNEVNETCDCPPRCTTTEYTLTISSSTNQFENQVGVNIYYESLIVEKRETTDSYTPWSFISDIGGNTGLFLGITLLSWVELMLLALGLIKDCCYSCCKTYRAPADDVVALELPETT